MTDIATFRISSTEELHGNDFAENIKKNHSQFLISVQACAAYSYDSEQIRKTLLEAN